MAKKFKLFTLFLCFFFAVITALYFFHPTDTLLSISITVGVFAYHFLMRLIVGVTVNKIFKNNIAYTRKWFTPLKFEENLYRFMRVKLWKKYIPTYSPVTFSLAENPPERVVAATCQSEIVHEIIMVLSFLPIILAIPFGDAYVFIITSVFSALIDAVFVVLQRYNRPRLLKIVLKNDGKRSVGNK